MDIKPISIGNGSDIFKVDVPYGKLLIRDAETLAPADVTFFISKTQNKKVTGWVNLNENGEAVFALNKGKYIFTLYNQGGVILREETVTIPVDGDTSASEDPDLTPTEFLHFNFDREVTIGETPSSFLNVSMLDGFFWFVLDSNKPYKISALDILTKTESEMQTKLDEEYAITLNNDAIAWFTRSYGTPHIDTSSFFVKCDDPTIQDIFLLDTAYSDGNYVLQSLIYDSDNNELKKWCSTQVSATSLGVYRFELQSNSFYANNDIGVFHTVLSQNGNYMEKEYKFHVTNTGFTLEEMTSVKYDNTFLTGNYHLDGSKHVRHADVYWKDIFVDTILDSPQSTDDEWWLYPYAGWFSKDNTKFIMPVVFEDNTINNKMYLKFYIYNVSLAPLV